MLINKIPLSQLAYKQSEMMQLRLSAASVTY